MYEGCDSGAFPLKKKNLHKIVDVLKNSINFNEIVTAFFLLKISWSFLEFSFIKNLLFMRTLTREACGALR